METHEAFCECLYSRSEARVTNSFVQSEVSIVLRVDSINLVLGRSEEDGGSPSVVVKQFIAPPVIEEFHVPLSHLLLFSDHDSDLISILARGDVIHPNMCEQFRQKISDHGYAVAQLTMEERPRKMIMYINITSLKMANNQADQIIQRIMMGGNEEEHFLESMEANRVHTVPASQSAIDALEIKKVDEGDSTQACVVCLEEFSPGMDVTRMPCSHMFHGRCIVDWLHQKNECPLCRFKMPGDDEMKT
ncbi:hypothetical protein GIB67_012840 [Kingdonia uniflora]|uniref:RING-type E3 ubiquitin transferase n=1 Tax=Kingdonia uniflora TaxID=39325 RepID=A0A7J7NFV6_9MAGN|nr:hypothetical protein GIB67_012840 [Kingdonia uniflora]